MKFVTTLAGLALGLAVTAAQAEITVGVTISTTGPAASLGIPEKNTIAMMPTMLGSEKVRYIVLDDGSDPSMAVKNARKLTTEDKADLIIGSSTVPTSMALIVSRVQPRRILAVTGTGPHASTTRATIRPTRSG